MDCSRSGRKLVFVRAGRLALYEPGKSSVRNLSDGPGKARSPSISPGERYILYLRDDPTGQTHPEQAIILHDLRTRSESVVPTPPNTEHPQFAPRR